MRNSHSADITNEVNYFTDFADEHVNHRCTIQLKQEINATDSLNQGQNENSNIWVVSTNSKQTSDAKPLDHRPPQTQMMH